MRRAFASVSTTHQAFASAIERIFKTYVPLMKARLALLHTSQVARGTDAGTLPENHTPRALAAYARRASSGRR